MYIPADMNQLSSTTARSVKSSLLTIAYFSAAERGKDAVTHAVPAASMAGSTLGNGPLVSQQ